MLKYLLTLIILFGASEVADAKTIGAKGNYLCLAAKINKHIKELQPLYYGKEAQVEAVYCNSVEGDYIVLKENQGNLTVFRNVEQTDDLIVGQTNEREIIVQPETNIYKLDNEYSQFNHSEIAQYKKQLIPQASSNASRVSNSVSNNANNASGGVYAD